MDLWVDSVPFGAGVRLGRELLGVTPLRVNRASLSHRPLEISLPGFRPVVVGGDLPDTGVLDVRLEPLGSTPGNHGRPAEFGRRSLECGLVLLGSGSAVLGLHYKRMANEAYDEYLQTGNDRKIRSQFQRAENYDRAALGCWVVAEVSLIGFLYLLLDSPEAEEWNIRPEMDGTGDECGVKIEWNF